MRHFVRPRIGNFELGRFSLGRNYQCLLVETTNSHRLTTAYFRRSIRQERMIGRGVRVELLREYVAAGAR